jgi:RNA-directed DNA polymerase
MIRLTQIPELQITTTFIKRLSDNADTYYIKTSQPKMKFGRPQIDKDGLEKMRHIVKPIPILKIKQKQINSFIQTIPLPSSMFGGIKERNNLQNAAPHKNSRFFLTIDLKSFFSNITNTNVNRIFRSCGFSWREARILTKLTTYQGSLPQGAPTSTTLANLVFSSTALRLEKFCSGKKIIFTNFVDDLTFSAKNDFKYCKSNILEILKQDGFFVNHNKIHYRKGACEITGLFLKNGQLGLDKEMLKNINKPGIRAYVNLLAAFNSALKKFPPQASVVNAEKCKSS